MYAFVAISTVLSILLSTNDFQQFFLSFSQTKMALYASIYL